MRIQISQQLILSLCLQVCHHSSLLAFLAPIHPSIHPSILRQPSETPSLLISGNPSHEDSDQPRVHPFSMPSGLPSFFTSSIPSAQPSILRQPSETPSLLPSGSPSHEDLGQPTAHPSSTPSEINEANRRIRKVEDTLSAFLLRKLKANTKARIIKHISSRDKWAQKVFFTYHQLCSQTLSSEKIVKWCRYYCAELNFPIH